MKAEKLIWIIFTIMLIGLAWFGIQSYKAGKEQYLSYKFNGRVENINYSSKGYPEVMINGDFFYLNVGWDNDHIIEVGDTLKKDSGQLKVILIKHQSNKVLRFDRM